MLFPLFFLSKTYFPTNCHLFVASSFQFPKNLLLVMCLQIVYRLCWDLNNDRYLLRIASWFMISALNYKILESRLSLLISCQILERTQYGYPALFLPILLFHKHRRVFIVIAHCTKNGTWCRDLNNKKREGIHKWKQKTNRETEMVQVNRTVSNRTFRTP